MNELFQVELTECPRPECPLKYFIVANWKGKRWKIFEAFYESPVCVGIQKDIASLRERGWSHIHVGKLPL